MSNHEKETYEFSRKFAKINGSYETIALCRPYMKIEDYLQVRKMIDDEFDKLSKEWNDFKLPHPASGFDLQQF